MIPVILALLDAATVLFLLTCLPTSQTRNTRRALVVFTLIVFFNLLGWIVL